MHAHEREAGLARRQRRSEPRRSEPEASRDVGNGVLPTESRVEKEYGARLTAQARRKLRPRMRHHDACEVQVRAPVLDERVEVGARLFRGVGVRVVVCNRHISTAQRCRIRSRTSHRRLER